MRFALLAALFTAALVGCGKKKDADRAQVSGTSFSGKLTQGGTAVKFQKDEIIKITFHAEGPDKVSAIAEVNKDTGEFKIDGPDGKGIPAGKYKVALTSEIYGGDGTDRFADKFDLKSSPFTADVGAEPGQVFTVDIGTKKVTKGK